MIDEWTLAPGGLIPPHTHTREDECSYVLQGELACYVGEVPHAFYNAGAGAVRVMEILTPGQSFEGYFDEYEPLASRGTSDDEHNRMRAELGKSYGITWHDDLVPEVEASFGICG